MIQMSEIEILMLAQYSTKTLLRGPLYVKEEGTTSIKSKNTRPLNIHFLLNIFLFSNIYKLNNESQLSEQYSSKKLIWNGAFRLRMQCCKLYRFSLVLEYNEHSIHEYASCEGQMQIRGVRFQDYVKTYENSQ